ncbi:MAG: multidrug ABC transporter ATP-binding protein, partial [Betaproteobacteria bacterium HGW-Betaproteobacteria-18]
MYRWFEKLLYPFPETMLKAPPGSFWAFVWAGTQGLRVHLALMTLLTAGIGAFEALLFAMMGKIVDWLT